MSSDTDDNDAEIEPKQSRYEVADDDFEIERTATDLLGPDGPVLVSVESYGQAAAQLLSGGQVEEYRNEYGQDFPFDRDAVAAILKENYASPDFTDFSRSDFAEMKPGAVQLFLFAIAPTLMSDKTTVGTHTEASEDFESTINLEDMKAPDHLIRTRAGHEGDVICRLASVRTVERHNGGGADLFDIDDEIELKLLKEHYPSDYGFGDVTLRQYKNAPVATWEPYVMAIMPDMQAIADVRGNLRRRR